MLLSIRRLSEQFCASDLRLTRRVRRLSDGRVALAGFAAISRLGDGLIWYLLMLALLLFGGDTGQRATLQMALLGITSLVIYKALKRISRRPRPLAVEHALGTDAPASGPRASGADAREDPCVQASDASLRSVERAALQAQLKAHRGSRAELARKLGISERSLYRKLRDIEREPPA